MDTKEKSHPNPEKHVKIDAEAQRNFERVLREMSTDEIAQFVPSLGKPFSTCPKGLYNSKVLYDGYDFHDEKTFETCYDTKVYRHYIAQGKYDHTLDETLARALHDHFITHALNVMLEQYNEKDVIGVMGGHAKRRDDPGYRQIVFLSKKLTEMGRLMVNQINNIKSLTT